jgi:putative glutamine amidotransferase
MSLQPLVGIMCCNEFAERPIQAVASRFIEPVARYSGATPVLIPALPDAFEAASLSGRLDGLLLTGSRSNIMPHRYGRVCDAERLFDEQRDEAALRLAGCMIERGRAVFGICRGMQELNVLFGGTLTCGLGGDHHLSDCEYEEQFAHQHMVELTAGGQLASGSSEDQIKVTSVHQEGIERLGASLNVEARALDDGLIEAFAAPSDRVLAVQWHPEWRVDSCQHGQHFFSLFGSALHA